MPFLPARPRLPQPCTCVKLLHVHQSTPLRRASRPLSHMHLRLLDASASRRSPHHPLPLVHIRQVDACASFRKGGFSQRPLHMRRIAACASPAKRTSRPRPLTCVKSAQVHGPQARRPTHFMTNPYTCVNPLRVHRGHSGRGPPRAAHFWPRPEARHTARTLLSYDAPSTCGKHPRKPRASQLSDRRRAFLLPCRAPQGTRRKGSHDDNADGADSGG